MNTLKRFSLIISAFILVSTSFSSAIDLKGSTFSHDPATLIKDGATYWHFFTAPGIGAASSKDMINWTSSRNRIFQTGTNWKTNYPAWTIPYFGSGTTANTDGNLWAPDVIFMNGAFYLYYSCSSFGSSNSAIGCVRSTSLNNPKWEDMGMVVSSKSKSDFNAIDPGLFKDDDGKVYMVYGSFSAGIGIVDIDTVSGLATTAVKYLAGESGRSYEAPALFKENGLYYLVINRGSCCNGLSSTYFIIMGRSRNVKGPYQDFRDLLPNKDGKYIGPGHFSLYRDKCANYVSIHYYDGTANGQSRLDLLKMEMLNGWPVLSRDFSIANCNNTNLEFVNKQDAVTIYPNPATNILNLNIESLCFKLSVYDVYGKEIISKQFNGESKSLDISNLVSGIYYLSVLDGNEFYTRKFVKK